jgi:hypothetical protein
MKSRKFPICIAIAAFASAIAGCNVIQDKSPSDVVKAAYMAANDGNYSAAAGYLSKDAREAIESGLGVLIGGMKGAWDKATRDCTIDRIDILEETIRGEGATVRIKIHFKDGSSKKDNEKLIREDGRWKMTIG